MIRAFLTTVLLFHLFVTFPAFAWSDKGHRIVALIATAYLSDEARHEVKEILSPGATLADASIWPDHEGRSLRELNALHFVSIPDDAAGYDQARDCPQKDCIVEALKWYATSVADKNAPLALKRMALRYVVHLVGDIHQPLHAGRATDLGGNTILVSYRGEVTNLHLFWDFNLVEMEDGSEDEAAKRLRATLSDADRLRWQTGNPASWANESALLARTHAYPKETTGEFARLSFGERQELFDGYVANARPVVRTRLLQAGIRLAWLLNSTFR